MGGILDLAAPTPLGGDSSRGYCDVEPSEDGIGSIAASWLGLRSRVGEPCSIVKGEEPFYEVRHLDGHSESQVRRKVGVIVWVSPHAW